MSYGLPGDRSTHGNRHRKASPTLSPGSPGRPYLETGPEQPAAIPPDAAPDERAPEIPRTVAAAVYFMLTGALATLTWAAVGFFDSPGGQDDLGLTFGVVNSVLVAGLWVWVALSVEAGRSRARTLATVLFGINTVLFVVVLVLVTALGAALPVSTVVGNAVLVGLGLGAVLALWQPSSAPHFAPPPSRGYQPYLR